MSIFKKTERSGKTRWAISVYVGRDPEGREVKVYRSGFRTRKEAEQAKADLLLKLRDSKKAFTSPETVQQATERWLKLHAARNCAPKTVERYRQLAAYYADTLGDVKLSKLTRLMVDEEITRLREYGGRGKRKGKPLSPKTVRNIHGVLTAVLNKAVKWGIARTNPAARIDLPPIERKEAKALDPEKLDWYLAAALGHPYLHPLLVLIAATGVRRGEALALTWADLQGDTLTVDKSLEQTADGLRLKPPKNGKPRRLPLPAMAVRALDDHRKEQQRRREMMGEGYRTDLDLIFADVTGEYLKPDSVSAAACIVANKAGLQGISLHSLRHSHGSQLLSAGTPLPTVSKRLGHSGVDITAKIYSHAFAKDELATAKTWDTLMRKALKGKHAKQ